jgi:hypothetical protein
MPAGIIIGFEHTNIIPGGKQPSGKQPADPGSDNGDFHNELPDI